MVSERIDILLREPIGRIDPRLHGHFAEHLGGCIEDGIWVGPDSPIENIGGIRRDVVEALRWVGVPVLRWPGGCFADDYHWEDGIGPMDQRPRTVNLWWGQTPESNCFGTHEFMHLCRLIGAEPYLSGNLGSGTVREMRDWVEYCNFDGDSTLARRRAANGAPEPFNVRFWGVGNEAWGCGGSFCPEDYAAQYKRYANYLHDLTGRPLYLIACGPDGNDHDWTRRFFTKLGGFRRLHGFGAHYYTWNKDGRFGTATDFTLEQWYQLLARSLEMEMLVVQQRAILDEFDPQRRIGLIVDEWGAWHPPTPGRHPLHLWQQNTMRDALVAALTLDIFHRHADKLAMANLAQVANVLQALVLTEGDRMVLTPTYHVFNLYRSHREQMAVRLEVETQCVEGVPALSGSASTKGGALTLSIVNSDAESPREATLRLREGAFRELSVRELAHADIRAHNSFAAPDRIRPKNSFLALGGSELAYTFAPASVTVFEMRL